ncbi:MAG: hypothetical protein KatS3mg082_1834 [Nitrospiraceae bacterium]|nr:MAG: hypothetical protein KatS3mg082_1834 [Nitrospiraceae bacterium]
MNTTKSQKLFAEAQRYMPGGVNSPVRAFRSVGGQPLFIKRAKGSRLYDVDGNSFIDYVLSWGPMILGHAPARVIKAIQRAAANGTSYGAPTELEVRLARMIHEAIPSMEKIRLVSSGTEAVMSAIRVARAYTKRDAILKFEGCYHGHSDYLLAKAGSGLATLGIPDSPGGTGRLDAPYHHRAVQRHPNRDTTGQRASQAAGVHHRRADRRQHGRRAARPGFSSDLTAPHGATRHPADLR